MRIENAGEINCPSCGAALIAGLRFCRMCGYRLGEGVEEFVATQRLNQEVPTATQASRATDPFAARSTWNAAPPQTFGTNSLKSRDSSSLWSRAGACNRSRGGWMIWMILMIVFVSAGGVVTKSLRNVGGGGGGEPRKVTTSLRAEVDGFDTVEGGGVLIEGLDGPDTSYERAGLIGGDIITSFDGKPVKDESAMRRIIAETTPGKTVEVAYIRDGVAAKTTLTTMARQDYHGRDALKSRPGGEGTLEMSDYERVSVPGSNVHGVRVGDIDRNGPADLAGLKEGDVVVEFNGKSVRTPGDLRLRVEEAVPGSIASVVVMRGTERVEIPVKVGRSKD